MEHAHVFEPIQDGRIGWRQTWIKMPSPLTAARAHLLGGTKAVDDPAA
jgi:hypothetical protein